MSGSRVSIDVLAIARSGSARLWAVAIALTTALLAVFLSQVNLNQLTDLWRQVEYSAIVLALGLLCCEGLITAQRIRLFASGNPTFGGSLLANAWYSILVVILPARLGELAAVVVFEKILGQQRGGAVTSIIAQRLFDLIVLSTLFAVALIFLAHIPSPHVSALLAAATVLLALVLVVCMEQILTVLARLIIDSGPRDQSRFRRALLRVVLQGRIWRRHHCCSGLESRALLLTLIKWLSTLLALALVIGALTEVLDPGEALAASAAYCFISIIPLHTIGGLGVGEAGLAAILMAAGLPLGIAAAVSLLVRCVLIIFPAMFFLLVLLGQRIAMPLKLSHG